jgi:hypothetical protein
MKLKRRTRKIKFCKIRFSKIRFSKIRLSKAIMLQFLTIILSINSKLMIILIKYYKISTKILSFPKLKITNSLPSNLYSQWNNLTKSRNSMLKSNKRKLNNPSRHKLQLNNSNINQNLTILQQISNSKSNKIHNKRANLLHKITT